MPPDPREAELIATVASVVAHLIVAHEHVDHAELMAQVTRLLNAVATYSNAPVEHPHNEALRRAVAMLGR
jgi:glyoxylase-like metal-dependent hydrolase (beta-lactamase superfamily II)